MHTSRSAGTMILDIHPFEHYAGVTGFHQKMSDVLDNPSFETKQRILRLVVDKILVGDEEVTIQHTVPISDGRLWGDHYSRRSSILFVVIIFA
jgi:hypothetical protein